MSPAPETVRPGFNPTPPISVSTILSRSPHSVGPFSADRRASIRRTISGGPRPAPFQRQTVTLYENREQQREGNEHSRALLVSALEARRRRIEELRNGQTSITTTIAEQWRRQRDAITSLQSGYTPVLPSSINVVTESPEIEYLTPSQLSSPTRLTLEDMTDVETDDDDDDDEEDDDDDDDDEDPDNKFPASMGDVRRTPPPTFLTPNTSPASQATMSPLRDQEDDSARNAYTISCRVCANILSHRGMRARLVADSRIHIWSTDEQPNVILAGEKYATTTCQCELIDIACPRCETVVGYHIAGSTPCGTCSRSNHNAHYHLLRTTQTIGVQNLNTNGFPMSWSDIS